MSITALHTAATGLSSMSTAIDVAANNLANINTSGFKASRVNFEDLLYMDKAQPGVLNANGNERPTGIQVGLGVQVSNTDRIMTQGQPEATDNPLDMMINGDGFFQVNLGNGQTGYTRSGNFTTNRDGELVLDGAIGARLEPAITIPDEAAQIRITQDGQISYFTNDDPSVENPLGQITLTKFVNPKGLMNIGNNILVPSAASGDPIEGQPDTEMFGKIIQGSVERSNVNPVTQLIELIQTQRAFELNSQSIQAADQALQTLNNLRRF